MVALKKSSELVHWHISLSNKDHVAKEQLYGTKSSELINMKTKSKIYYYHLAMIMLLLTITNGCKKEKPEPFPVNIPTVITEISDISSTSAIVYGDIISCQGSWGDFVYNLGRGICWSNINLNPTFSGDSKGDTSNLLNCSFSIKLDYLTPGTTYYVRAFAENIVGRGYGNVVEFSTLGSIIGDIHFNPDLTYGTLSDIAGNTYKTIKIGSQTWMAENLKTSKYNDNTDIPIITDQKEWVYRSTPAYCWYINDESKYKNTYGALYNWYTVETGKLCPSGWHVPSLEEWGTLYTNLDEMNDACGQLREPDTIHWITTNTEVTNSSGFTALPGGTRIGFLQEYYPDLDYFVNLGYAGDFWSTSEEPDLFGCYIGSSWYFYYDNSCGYYAHGKSTGLSIRCLKDN